MHFCVSSISAWWFVWRFCYIRNVLLFPTHLMCTRHPISERLSTYSWFQSGSVKFMLLCKYSCIPLNETWEGRYFVFWWGLLRLAVKKQAACMQPGDQLFYYSPLQGTGVMMIACLAQWNNSHDRWIWTMDPLHKGPVLSTHPCQLLTLLSLLKGYKV